MKRALEMKLNQLKKISILELVLSIPKTLYFNFKVLPIKRAIKIPFIVSHNIKLKGINRKTFIVENETLSFASSRIGFEYTVGAFQESKKGIISIEEGKIILKGNVGLSQGIVLSAKNSNIIIGKNFRCNYSTQISSCDQDIIIGNNVVLGWKVTIKSDDGHYLIDNGKTKSKCAQVIIGEHVWLCSNSSLLKGSKIGNDCVVAYGSLITNKCFGNNTLIGGIPAHIIKENIEWKE